MVSVVVTTYQHAAFIEKCIGGILMQQTTFPVEILIGEDESTDGTREICQRLAAEHPERITLFLRSRKDMIRIMGRPTGRSNFLRLLASASGKYIAICEGDDHWIDPLKLQRQVDALERNPGASACFTNVYNEQEGVRKDFVGSYTRAFEGDILTEAQYLTGQGIPTCSICFRSEYIQGFSELVRPFATPDTALFTSLLGMGHFIYQPMHTAVRVMHPGGVYSMQGALHHLKVQLRNIHEQDKLSKGRHHALIQRRRAYALKTAWQEGVRTKNWLLARFAWKQLAKERAIMKWSMGNVLVNGFMVHFPGVSTRLEQWNWRAKGLLARLTSSGQRGKKA